MTSETEVKSVELLSETVDRLLEVIPVVEPGDVRLRGQLEAVKVDARHERLNSTYWWKRALQLFGNRVLEIRETVQEADRPAWIATARKIIEEARG